MELQDIAQHLFAFTSGHLPALGSGHFSLPDLLGHGAFLQEGPIAEPAPLPPVEGEVIGEAPVTSAEDFTMWALFLRADIIVKLVMLVLVLASIWSWAIIIEKWLRYGTLARKADRFESLFWSGKSLDDLYKTVGTRADHPMAAVFIAAMREWRRSFEAGAVTTSLLPSVKQRLDRIMSVTISREIGSAERYLGFLATVGSTAPFVGLFGTVWGIMNSFRAIAGAQNTSLDVVAPGIAEALFATALGLLAAIPAVIAYNNLSASLQRYSSRLEGFADEFASILSRQLDERAR